MTRVLELIKEHRAKIELADALARSAGDETWRACWLDIADQHREFVRKLQQRLSSDNPTH
jgi:hypothetical protein